MKKLVPLTTALMFTMVICKAQCPIGQVPVTLEISTDNYGEEGYWELVPAGNACGIGTIISGGNTAQLNCNSAGTPATSTTGNGYANNSIISVPYTCLTSGASYSIKYIDDYGDGGFSFKVKVNGYIVSIFSGAGSSHTFTFLANEPPNYDLASSKYMNTTFLQTNYILNNATINLKLKAFNWGKQTINSLKLNYSVNSGSTVSNVISGLNLANYSDTVLSATTPFSSTTNGTYNIKMWFSDFNGSNIDSIPLNDTTLKTITVGDAIPNIIASYIGFNLSNTVVVSSSNQVSTPVDIDFHPNLVRKEMWVLNKNTEASGGSSVIVSNTSTPNQTSVYKEDGNNWHFMSLPTAMAFSDNENFGTSPGVFDANHNGGAPFTGPALWTSDLAIYGGPAAGNGDHLDMLHESPNCQGIAWEKENVFWVFDGYNNDIVRYDFAGDHNPGNDDHSDGIIHRYADFAVAKDPAEIVPSHLALDKNRQWLYIVDNGNDRIMRINIQTGNVGGTPSFGPHEPVHEYQMVTGYTYETVVSSGLTSPCGIDIIDNRMLVTDHTTNEIIFYDITALPAVELYRVIIPNTNGIMGVKVGPDGKIYVVDNGNNRVIRLEPTSLNSVTELSANQIFNVFPTLVSDKINISTSSTNYYNINVYNSLGQVIVTRNENSNCKIETSLWQSGIYTVQIQSNNNLITKKIIKQ
jgi:sugar lactone lactonase YvrE